MTNSRNTTDPSMSPAQSLAAAARRSAKTRYGLGLSGLDARAARDMAGRDAVEAALAALREVANRDPDRARLRDGRGFARCDMPLGHALASAPSGEVLGRPSFARLAMDLARKYRRQVPNALAMRMGLTDQYDLFD
ncbi:hypothetical protein [Oricola nitratireducens]|uniref:hypothetical protein n=1 Tax=Oricola nitratireducens TaxID=2775868 RepID=UPI00186870FC|nr:hypothetical protein [Oricola nitratireducens]